MQLEVGKIVEGKVTGITKFGAFVELESGEVGMVHISEVANTYVSDISEHLQNGQKVTVKIMSVGDDGKISLSIKKAALKDTAKKDFVKKENYNKPNQTAGSSASYNKGNKGTVKSSSFEDMLSSFMQMSDEKISGIKRSREVSRRGSQRRYSKNGL